MGEEKPDEELMGKRKSSPRLSTTFDDVDNLSIAHLVGIIHSGKYCNNNDMKRKRSACRPIAPVLASDGSSGTIT